MATFSERYGYIKPSDILIRKKITLEVQNAICSCYDRLREQFTRELSYVESDLYMEMEEYLWIYFLNKRKSEFKTISAYHQIEYSIVATTFIENKLNPWYRKIDIIERTVKYLHNLCNTGQYVYNTPMHNIVNDFVLNLNNEFKRLNFAYRIINKEVVEVSSEEEIDAIETALKGNLDNIRLHINEALHLYSIRPIGDYRNSIKESISAVEAYCREKTGEDTLGKALNKLEKNHIIIPNLLKIAFDKLYAYTNQRDTGIRHALMDDEGTYTPTEAEALFMLVSCCAFINYLNKKVSSI